MNTHTGQYATVNNLNMYYEIHGLKQGIPLVLIHGGGSTIETTFGRILPILAEKHKIIAVELQAHGRTGDRDAWETFDQDADDVAGLLVHLNIPKANILGFSNGGQTTMVMGMRHPHLVNKIIIASGFYKRNGVPNGFWEGMEDAKFSDMPQVFKDEYLKLGNTPEQLMNMFNKDVQRMQNFKDWDANEINKIQAPALIIMADHDVATPEHAVEIHRLIPNSNLVVFPGLHGEYLGEMGTGKPGSEMPLATAIIINDFLLSTIF